MNEQKKKTAMGKKHKNCSLKMGQNVLWTDEFKFEHFGSKRRVCARKNPGKRLNDACMFSTVKHGGGSVSVWGSLSGRRRAGDLFQVKGIMKKTQYHSIP